MAARRAPHYRYGSPVVVVVLVRRNAEALRARRPSGLLVLVLVMDRKYRPILSGRTWRTAMRLWILLL